MRTLTGEDRAALSELLCAYGDALAANGQPAEAAGIRALLETPDALSVIKPGGEIVDQTISTE